MPICCIGGKTNNGYCVPSDSTKLFATVTVSTETATNYYPAGTYKIYCSSGEINYNDNAVNCDILAADHECGISRHEEPACGSELCSGEPAAGERGRYVMCIIVVHDSENQFHIKTSLKNIYQNPIISLNAVSCQDSAFG